MSDYDFILDDFLWSFSSLESFHNCKYGWFLNYINRTKSRSSAFSDYGSWCHKLLEEYLKGEKFDFELEDAFKNGYSNKVVNQFPPVRGTKLYDKYYEQGCKYFSSITQLEKLSSNKILGVEHKHIFYIDKYKFTGVLDVEGQDKNGNYIIVDHKSKSKQDVIKPKRKENPDDFIKLTDGRLVPRHLFTQQYLYCIPFKEQYGEYPKYLNLNMFRISDWYQIEFNEKDFERAIQWALETIHDIYNETEWKPTCTGSDFFCDWLCSFCENCKYCDKYLGD